MSARRRILLTIAAAAACLSLAATASANRLSLNAGTFRFVWPEWTLAFTEPTESSVRCPLTLTGTFATTALTKTTRGLVGNIVNSAIGFPTCANGRPNVLAETLPWHVRYESFTGTLPAIGSIALEVIGLSYRWELNLLSISCLFSATEAAPARWRASLERGGAITSVRWDETKRIPGTGIILCPREATFGGTGTATQASSTAAVRVTLI